MVLCISICNIFLSIVQNVILTLILSRTEINISIESVGEIAYIPNEENFDSIINDITLELSNGNITDIYEASGDH